MAIVWLVNDWTGVDAVYLSSFLFLPACLLLCPVCLSVVARAVRL